MSTAYTDVSTITGLVAEGREALMVGRTEAAGDFERPFSLSARTIATLQVTPMLTPSGYRDRNPGQPITTEQVRKGDVVTYTRLWWEMGVALDSLARRTLDPMLMNELMREFGMLQSHAFLQGLYDTIYNDAWTTNGPDNVPLVSNSHPSPGLGGVQDNLIASALDNSVYEQARIALRKQTGPDGQKLGLDGELLLGPVDLESTMHNVVGAGVMLGTSGYAVQNPNAGTATPLATSFMDSTTRVLLVSRRFIQRARGIVILPSNIVVKEDPNTVSDLKIMDEFAALIGYDYFEGVVGIGA